MDEQQKQEIRDFIREELAQFSFSDRFVSPKTIQILDGRNVIIGTAVGTIWGTESTQRQGWYGKSPVARQAAVTDAPTRSGSYVQQEAQLTSDAVNALKDTLQAYGFLP